MSVRHYFAFGSNMNPQRVRDRGLAFDHVSGAVLADAELVFDKRSADHPRSGHANVVFRRGGRVEGVLYRLADADQILRMDPFERTPINYSRDAVIVTTDGGPVHAWTYFAESSGPGPGCPPRGRLHGPSAGRPTLAVPEWIARLEAWPLAEDPA
ncbi:MAG: gamma-glutamylcyclotransferase family protein [Gammaproteobacteria bacterium]|nr:gamma-glutamylcyclotransferase family protein [Gammaproteobacteria bacterium]